MPHLILLRHAKAESVSDSGRDFERSLTERGRRDAALMGKVLAQAGLAPDLVLVSAAWRAMQTWEAASPAFPGARIDIRHDLYLASCEQMANAALSGAGAARLMIVAHNPGLHEYALELSGGDPEGRMAAFPTAAAAVFELDAAGRTQSSRMLLARDHGGGAF